MGKNIKIELELPEFEKELVVSVTLKRDGEAITASPSTEGIQTSIRSEKKEPSAPVWKQTPAGGGSNSSNMMDMSF